MRTRTRGSLAIASLAVLAMTVAACGGSSKSGGGSTSTGGTSGGLTSANNGIQGVNPGTGAPTKGGTLNMLGDGDVDWMDYNASYYTIGYLAQRMYLRGLYAYPAVPNKVTTVAPDLATALPVVSNGGKTFTVTIRSGAQWNTTPARQVTGADAVLGLKRACNPTPTRFGGLPDFINLIAGYADYCNAFAKVSPTNLGAIKTFINTHNISGVTSSGNTVTYNLTQPASYFADQLTLPAFNPAPIESLNYLPGSVASETHQFADGPYEIKSYVPAKSIQFVRNPAWNASTDPIRKAYVNAINVSETGNPITVQQILQTNTASGGMEFNSFPPVASLPGLIAQMKAGNKNFNLGPSYGSNPYLDFNTVSPNNGGALGKVAVRQALSYAVDRAHLIQDLGGPQVSPALTHILPAGINGAQYVPAGYNPFPYNPAKAKSMLKAAGYPNGLNLTVLYNAESTTEPKMFQSLQADMAPAGIHLKALAVPSADLYVKYLTVPSTAKNGTWDIGMSGWGPDWYGDAAASFFEPIYSGAGSFPPTGSNFSEYNNPAVNSLITKAASQTSAVTAGKLWAQIDKMVTMDAPTYQITQDLQPNYHSSFVHNAVYVPSIQNFDPTNVWLSTPGS
jgi:peptide/nickel transport system substrate-binding protein